VQAHHGLAADFDTAKEIEIEGVIDSLQWRNPHVSLKIIVDQGTADEALWVITTNSVSNLNRMDVTRELLSAGATVRVAGVPARNGAKALFMNHLLLEDGREVIFKRGATARWKGKTIGNSDKLHGKVAEVAFEKRPTNLFAVWTTVYDDPASWPLFPRFDDKPAVTAKAKSIMAGYDFEANNPLAHCAPKGMPSTMVNPYPIEFVDAGQTIQLKIEEYDTVRTIYLSQTHDDSKAEASELGYSTGRWEGDSLIVTTTKIDYPYLDVILKPLATPQSDNLMIREIFTLRPDHSHLDYVMIASDPEMLTKPLVVSKYYLWNPTASVQPYSCSED
jgi:hypothetical protein